MQIPRNQRGMTLIELLIAMTILAILSAAITGVLISQIRTSTSIQGQAIVTSDVNIALTMMQNDLAHAGLGMSIPNTGIGNPDSFGVRTVGTANGTDQVTTWGTNTGSGTGRWNLVLSYSEGNEVDSLVCRRWTGSDSLRNCKVNDTLHMIDGAKNFVGINSIKSITSQSGDTIIFKLNRAMLIPKGAVMTQVNTTTSGTVIVGQVTYSMDAANRQLLRNGIPFLSNVEGMMVRWMWDNDGNGTIDSVSEASSASLTAVIDPQYTRRPLVIGVTLITSSPTVSPAVVDSRAGVSVWGGTVPLTAQMQRRYRNTYTIYVRPRNIGT